LDFGAYFPVYIE